MSTSDYDRLYNNVYTKSEVDNAIQSNSSSDMNNIIDNVFGGLGNSVTEEQSANIANGSFKGLPIGAYWSINNIKYRIMAHDQFYGYNSISTHHVVVMPDTCYNNEVAATNGSDYSSVGYIGTHLQWFINEYYYNNHLTSVFGVNHILIHTHDLTQTVNSTTVNNVTSYTGILTPVSGTKAWAVNMWNVCGSLSKKRIGYSYCDEATYNWQDADKIQFPAFKYNPDLIKSNYNNSTITWWGGSYGHYYRTSSDNGSGILFFDTDGEPSFSRSKYGSTIYKKGVRPVFLVY